MAIELEITGVINCSVKIWLFSNLHESIALIKVENNISLYRYSYFAPKC